RKNLLTPFLARNALQQHRISGIIHPFREEKGVAHAIIGVKSHRRAVTVVVSRRTVMLDRTDREAFAKSTSAKRFHRQDGRDGKRSPDSSSKSSDRIGKLRKAIPLLLRPP